MELARYGYTDRCIVCQHARLGLKPADHSEECRARTVRHMTAGDDLNQRVQIAQDELQTPEGTVVTNSRSTSSSSSSSSSDSRGSPTEIATSMQVDESNQDSSKKQKVTDGADMELEGLVMESERDRLQRY